MNKKIFLVTLICISIGIIAVYLFTTEQQVGIQKENQTQENHSSELSGIKNTFSDTQNSSINLTQTPPQQQNLSLSNITKNETYDRVYKYILKRNNHGKASEVNITTYIREELINGTKYVVAESKLDDIPKGLFSIDFLYDTIEYVDLQTGNIKLVKIPYEEVKNETLKMDMIKSLPENKSIAEFPSDIIYSDDSDIIFDVIYSGKLIDRGYTYLIEAQIGLFHLPYLIGFVKFEPEPENITLNVKIDLLDAEYKNSPFEGQNLQNLTCSQGIWKPNSKEPLKRYYSWRKFEISYIKNSTKGVIADKHYIEEKFDCIMTDQDIDYIKKYAEKQKRTESSNTNITIDFLGTEIFKGKEAYKIESKLLEEDGALFEMNTTIWIDKKDKIILCMNSTGELHGFASAKYTTIYELINESIVKK